MENVQVTKEHYSFEKYVSLKRWISYHYQIKEVMRCSGRNVLLIGPGDGIVVGILKDLGKNVTTLDFDKNLNPDIVGSITELDKLIHQKYDVVVCCQVLEHIPFEEFESIIQNISQYTIEKFILSLPNDRCWIKFMFRLPIIDEKTLLIPFRHFWRKNWDININGFGEHYWEIDATNKWKLKKIKCITNEYFDLERFYVVKERPYQMFFVLKSKSE